MNEFMWGICFGLFIVFLLILTTNPRENFYKKGQIDAINGKIAYHLVKQENGSTIWEEVNK